MSGMSGIENKVYMKKINYILLIIIIFSCSKPPEQENKLPNRTYNITYAKGFTAKIYDDYKEITVRDPWDTTRILQNYILVDKNRELPDKLPKGTFIRTPLEKNIVYSTVHSATLQEIGVIESIIGVCEPEHIAIEYIQKGIQNGTIANLGQAANPIIEKIIEINPEAIWVMPIYGFNYGRTDRTNIPIIETPDYMETTPLGRAEWIKFYAFFFNNESYVDSLFERTVQSYNAIKEKAASVNHRPTVFFDLMYRGSWYVPGGQSFMSKMIADAGAAYVWQDDNDMTSTLPTAFEQVLEKAGDADYWLIKYKENYTLTYRLLEKDYKPYSYFEAFKSRNIYECNTGRTFYYEDLPIRPDHILQDLAAIFHPDLFPDYTLRYYSKMTE
jgi:iron complex transport system substrate-binding protein